MKKLKFTGMLLMVSLLFIGLSSCSDDDDQNVGNIPAELLKTWYMGGGSSITFNANGTGTFVEDDGELAVLHAKTVTRTKTSYPFTYTYNETNQQIALTVDGDTDIWTIVSLTDDELKIKDGDGDLMQFSKTETAVPDPEQPIGSKELLKGSWGFAGIPALAFTEDKCTFYEDGTAEGTVNYNYENNRISFSGSEDAAYVITSLTKDYIKFNIVSEGQVKGAFAYFRIPEAENNIGAASLLYNKKWSTFDEGNITTFTLDGKGAGTFTFAGESKPVKFKYTYDEKTHKLTLEDSDGEKEVWEVTNLTEKIVYFQLFGEDGKVEEKIEYRVLD